MIRIYDMNPLDSSASAAQRANQTDPIVMYLIVRESLGMGMGKTAAQCAHAAQMLCMKYTKLQQRKVLSNEQIEAKNIYKEWLDGSFRKVVLKADDKEWEKVKAEFSPIQPIDEFRFQRFVLVVDAGLTEIAPMSETVMGLWPMRKSQVPKLIKRLQVLK